MASSTNQLYKKRSNVWNHFTLTNGNMAKCNYCNEKKSFSGGSTGNLLRHIKTKHVTVPLQRSTPQVYTFYNLITLKMNFKSIKNNIHCIGINNILILSFCKCVK